MATQPEWIKNQNINNRLTEVKARLNERYALTDPDMIALIDRMDAMLRNIVGILEIMHSKSAVDAPHGNEG